jgi:hypothetical protein
MINEEYEFTYILDTSIYSSLPSGLSLNPLTGEISGVATAEQENRTYTIKATNELNRVIISRINIKISSSLENINNFIYPETILAKDFSDNLFTLKPSFSAGNNIGFSSPSLPSGVILDSTSGLITGNLSSYLPLTEYTITASNSKPSTAIFKLQIGCDLLKTNITVGEFYIFSTVDTINNRIEEFFNYSLGYISKGSYCNANFGPSRGLLSKNFFFNSVGSYIPESILGIVLYRKVKKSDNTALNSFLVFEVKGNLTSVSLNWNKITFRNNIYLKGTATVFYNSSTDSTVYIFNNQITNPYFYQNGYTEIIINNASS